LQIDAIRRILDQDQFVRDAGFLQPPRCKRINGGPSPTPIDGIFSADLFSPLVLPHCRQFFSRVE
jgi:hypothetical protein